MAELSFIDECGEDAIWGTLGLLELELEIENIIEEFTRYLCFCLISLRSSFDAVLQEAHLLDESDRS